MKLTILGSGTSQGVPVIGCRCEVCTSTDSRDKRLRTSAMIETDGGARFVIDAGPDFRCQMLRAGVSRLDAILLTHEHKDHTGGIDDVRAFNFVDSPPVIHPVDIYAAPAAARVVRKDYDYAFEEEKYRGAPDIRLHEIDVARPLEIAGERIVPVSGHHSERFEVTGYRIGRMAYLTDFKTIADADRGGAVGGQRPAFSTASLAFQCRGGVGTHRPGRASQGAYHACVARDRAARGDDGSSAAGGRTGLRRIGNHNLKIWIFLREKPWS